MVICLERDADLHMAQLMPLPLTVSCFSKTQIGFTFLVPAHLGSPGQRAVKWVCELLREQKKWSEAKRQHAAEKYPIERSKKEMKWQRNGKRKEDEWELS